ncbi:hypothetical protein SapgrDRAFT_0502 [Saprospira grandis DSM 2844]|uniref:Uncharacterized protein n=1 Tax=Saprospira grandis DSM 2844 TaxID=694433 RepID=J0XTK7_9BACT|nr:hypothetical protein SapgrDRAFT_0502 [Saprospira grandis DSM 2844]
MRLFFWGCPALRAGRAVSGLAGLLGPSLFRYAQKLGLAFGPPYPSLSLRGLRPLLDRIKAQNKKLRIPFLFAIGIKFLQGRTAQNRNTGRCAQSPPIALEKLTLGKKEGRKN